VGEDGALEQAIQGVKARSRVPCWPVGMS